MSDKSPRGATLVVRDKGRLALEHPTFELEDDKGKKRRFDGNVVRLGAGPGNDFILGSAAVSSVHMEIATTARGFRLRDLGSTNGTFVNGVRVIESILEDGQTLTVGDVPFTFHVSRDRVSEPMSESEEFMGAVGRSPAMRAVFSRVERVAKTDATVLITGETGTGKEVIGWAIYEASKRAEKPFVVVDCGAIARNLIESELFGHEKGAFTGAVQRRIGAFERADQGTLFLDEIGELELELQPKLLRALERREIQRLGGEKTLGVDARIIAATNRDLRAMVARGEFREDLYYRLAVVTMELPPLRDRRDDVPALVAHFLKEMNASDADLPEGAMERFVEHRWPGNCRELKNAVERAVVLGEMKFLGSQVRPLPSDEGEAVVSGPHEAQNPESPRGAFEVVTELPYKVQKADVIADFEERYVRLLMREHAGNVSAAARQAGIDRMSLHKILARYELDAKSLAK